MFKTVYVTNHTHELDKIKELYKSAFPRNERMPFRSLMAGCSRIAQGVSGNQNQLQKSKEIHILDLLAFYDDDTFCGFAALFSHADITHIAYLAIDTKLRDKGYGGKALQAIKDIKPDNRIIVDIEPINHDEAGIRHKRRDFYCRNGFSDTDVTLDWNRLTYSILIFNGSMTQDELDDFMRKYED